MSNSRPGEDLMDQLSDVLGKPLVLFLLGGQVIDFKIDNIEVGMGLIHGQKQPDGQNGCFRASCILGYYEKD